VNIYAPIAGSNDKSSLIVIPTSHLWEESEIKRTKSGGKVNGLTYTVPAVVDATRTIVPLRPNPGLDEVLVFSPYCIHGGATNFTDDQTRVSLEIRFWRA
jgi:ectoine hydroxylase-related dioxygenase (phytanoyl-CoA dioxygenase family)